MSSNLADSPEKFERLNFKSYLQMIRNFNGSTAFRNFYLRKPDGTVFDAMEDGANSCAFYVSSLLQLWGKLGGRVHGTVSSTEKTLQQAAGWQQVGEHELEAGDVIVWAKMLVDREAHEHIGFYIGDDTASSASYKTKTVVEHNVHFDEVQRPIKTAYRQTQW